VSDVPGQNLIIADNVLVNKGTDIIVDSLDNTKLTLKPGTYQLICNILSFNNDRLELAFYSNDVVIPSGFIALSVDAGIVSETSGNTMQAILTTTTDSTLQVKTISAVNGPDMRVFGLSLSVVKLL
jgi:hypothetical protein